MIIAMTRGDSQNLEVVLKDIDGNLFEFMEGDIITFSVRTTTTANPILLQRVVTEFEDDGSAIINLQPSDTEPLRFRDYVCDVEFRRPIAGQEDFVLTIIKPTTFRIEGEVTY